LCGIFGLYSESGISNDEIELCKSAGEILKHRGPDGSGTFTHPNLFLLHRRLSIIDLQGGGQPLYNEDKSITIIFNGEIFNYKELMSILQKAGHVFSTESDTEAIIHAYEEWGEKCIDRLRGMFAFALWDQNNRKLLLVRDRLGIKPLYYTQIGDRFYFSSEIKAIINQRSFKKEIDNNALAAYFSLTYIPSPLSIFKNLMKLPPGHYMTIQNGNASIIKYWDVFFRPDYTKNEDYFRNRFNEIFNESVRLRMISDVPIGAFLSGGIDSGMVVSNMSKLSSQPVRTFTMGFGGNTGGYNDERKLAKTVSSYFNAEHREFEVQPDIKGIIEKIIRSFDEPFADDTVIPSYYLCQITRKHVTVALSGLGGDEVFGGYERYLGYKLSSIYNRLPYFLREKVIRQLIERIPERADGHYTVNHLKRFVRHASLKNDERYFGFISMQEGKKILNNNKHIEEGFKNCQDMFIDLYNSENAKEPLDKIFYCDMKTYLPEDILACTDRISMHHSLEVRVPFIDHKLLEFCATIPNNLKIKYNIKKYLLRKEAKNHLPQEVFKQRKQGFASPMTQWINSDIKEYVKEMLCERNLSKHGYFKQKEIDRLLEEHFTRKEIHDKEIWSILVFQTWFNLYM
jgi:asparagine synthase (glutamine-hydrolysing)